MQDQDSDDGQVDEDFEADKRVKLADSAEVVPKEEPVEEIVDLNIENPFTQDADHPFEIIG